MNFDSKGIKNFDCGLKPLILSVRIWILNFSKILTKFFDVVELSMNKWSFSEEVSDCHHSHQDRANRCHTKCWARRLFLTGTGLKLWDIFLDQLGACSCRIIANCAEKVDEAVLPFTRSSRSLTFVDSAEVLTGSYSHWLFFSLLFKLLIRVASTGISICFGLEITTRNVDASWQVNGIGVRFEFGDFEWTWLVTVTKFSHFCRCVVAFQNFVFS